MSKVGSEHWTTEAIRCAKAAGAYNVKQLVLVLKGVPYEDLASMCEDLFKQYPCLFKARLRDGIK